MGYTIAEKILSNHCHKKVKAGDIAVCDVDFCFSQDGTSELVIDSFRSLGKKKVFHGMGKYKALSQPLKIAEGHRRRRFSCQQKFAIVIDHSAPSPRQPISNIHQKLRAFSRAQNTLLFDVGCGVCHQVIPEAGLVLPGSLVVGADSHTCTYGALNAFACGLGSTDIAVTLASGKNWFRVPETIKIIVEGKIFPWITAKDIILYIIGQLGANGCTYLAVEFLGSAIEQLNMDGRFTISNMVVEMGAKCGLFRADQKTLQWVKSRTKRKFVSVQPDADAQYKEARVFNVSGLSPQIAKPHNVDNVVKVEELIGKRIDLAYLGTCTNGRLEDLEQAAQIFKNRHAARHVSLVIAPASKDIYLQAVKSGILEVMIKAGAVILPPGCGPCVGTHAGIPADEQVVISTANRNFKGRMGNPLASIYLASPLTLAASAVEGKIADPRKYVRT